MKSVFFFALLALMTVPCAALPTYNLELSVHPEQGTIQGNLRMTIPPGETDGKAVFIRLLLTNGEKPDPKLFPFYEHGKGPDGFSPSTAGVTNLTVNGGPRAISFVKDAAYFTTYGVDRMIARIDLSGVDSSAPVEIACEYHARLPHYRTVDDFFFDDMMVSRFSWFPYIAKEDRLAGLVFEPFTYQARITVSDGWDMARIGTAFRRDGNQFSVSSTSPVSSLPLVLLKGFRRYTVPWLGDQKALDILYRPTAEDAAHLVSAYAREALDYYAQRYLPYEANYVSVVQDNPGAMGMSSDSVVLLGDGVFGGLNRLLPDYAARPLEYMVDHEMGHLYWGIGEPVDFLSENYLSEGLNEYSTLSWYEQKYGRWDNMYSPQSDLLTQEILELTYQLVGHSYASYKIHSVFANRALGWDEPLSAPAAQKIGNAATAIDYDKAWFVISMLARYVGREQFQAALGDLAQNNRYKLLSSKVLAQYLGERTGKDLSAFFKAFVYGTKSVDYDLTGRLNAPVGTGYESGFTLRDKQDSGIFIPTTLTLFLQDGTTKEVPIDSPGDLVITTNARISYAAVDRDAENLDYDRKNNFWPRRIVSATDTDYWLTDVGTDILYPPFYVPYVGTEADTNAFDIGTGFVLTDGFTYSVGLNPFFAVPQTLSAQSVAGFGAALTAAWTPASDSSLSLSLVYRYPTVLSSATLTGSRVFYVPTDEGASTRTMTPAISLSGALSAVGMDMTVAGSGYAAGSASLALNEVVTTGTMAVLQDDARWHWSSQTLEDRAALDLTQGIPFIPRTLLGVEMKASAGFGSLSTLAGSNTALGIGSVGGGVYAYDASALVFLGMPLFNHIDEQMFNAFVLQSLNIALVYQAATAFNGPSDFVPLLQQAVGVELLPFVRTISDVGFGFAIGVGFNINAISAAPLNGNSWVPSVFVDLSTLPSLFSGVAPY